MTRPLPVWCIGILMLLSAGGCATSPPVPFQLIDSASRIQPGNIFPDVHRLEVMLDEHLFTGFYIVATGTAISQTLTGRRFIPRDTVTTVFSNSARAHLTADNGQQLNCEFLFEGRRALGECRTPAGATYQLTADGK